MTEPQAEALSLLEISLLILRFGVLTAATLAFIILVHELGHFMAARIFNVRINKFSIGFGKELFGWTDRKGTRWCFSRIPIGGYVMIFGDVDPDKPVIWDTKINAERTLSSEELAVAFCTKKVWQRMIIVGAGPAINVFLALSLLAGLYTFRGVPVNPPVINAIAIGTASYDAGFQLGDRILKLDGKPVNDFLDVYEVTWKDFTNPHEYKVLRDNKEITITMTAREGRYTDVKGRVRSGKGRTGMMNASYATLEDIKTVDGINTGKDADKARSLLLERLDKPVLLEYDLTDEYEDVFLGMFPASLNEHLKDPSHQDYDKAFQKDINKIEYKADNIFYAYGRASKQIYDALYATVELFSVLHKGRTKERGLGGVVVVGKYVGKAAKSGFENYIIIVAILSMGIAIMNILPIPLLDGGFMVFLIYEALTGKRVSPRIQTLSFALALVFLAGIMIIANLIDMIYFFS